MISFGQDIGFTAKDQADCQGDRSFQKHNSEGH